jgi:segregation and condensation protein B
VTPLAQLLEAALFSASRPLTAEELATLDPDASPADVRVALEQLREHYDFNQHGIELVELAGGYQILSRPIHAASIERAQFSVRTPKLTAATLETLAVIAYRQPVGRIEIEEIRGVSAGGVLRSLQERGLIEVVGRSEALGRPLLYGTTPLFLELLGMRDLANLPKAEELTIALRPHRAVAEGDDDAAAYVDAETLIEDGRVRVDGKTATIGMKVDPDRQRITVGNRPVKMKERRWLAFHKPLGVVTTAKDEEGRRTVLDFIPESAALTYVGRLDVMTTGLLLLTTDGEAVHRLTHPRYRIPRRYTALVHGRPAAEIAAAARERIVVDGRPVVPSEVRVRPGTDGRSIIDLTLAEGRNRIVRRWCETMGLKVDRLARLSYGPVRLGDLAPGRYRPLTPREEVALYKAIRLDPEAQ